MLTTSSGLGMPRILLTPAPIRHAKGEPFGRAPMAYNRGVPCEAVRKKTDEGS